VKPSTGILPWAVAGLALAACSAGPPSDETCTDGDIDAGDPQGPLFATEITGPFQLLLYTYSTGYRHAAIPAGIAAMRALGVTNGFRVVVKGSAPNRLGAYCGNRPQAADLAYFTRENLAAYAAVIFLNTTSVPDGPLLDEAGQAALEVYVRAGGGFVGIHAAADAEYAWDFYRELVGASFLAHGPAVTASLRIEDATHPATSGLPNPWSRFDEWFDFSPSPRAMAHVLVNLDETTYPDNPAPMGDHPIAWCKTVGAGRSFYTGLGHTPEAFGDALVRRHLLGGVLYAAGAIAANCSPPGT
jgi:type 1 glutamine amidotransferase